MDISIRIGGKADQGIQSISSIVAETFCTIGIPFSDGTWSHSEPEWNSFLAIHALKNKGPL